MNEDWSKLIVVLNQVGDIYEKMVVLAEEKKEALISVNVSVVNKIITKEEELIKQIDILEKDRAIIVDKIAQENNWQDNRVKLMILVERAPEFCAQEMKDVGRRLADIILKIATLNGVNNNLLKQAMRVIEYNINILSRSQALPFYQAGGNQQAEGNNMGLSFLDRKA